MKVMTLPVSSDVASAIDELHQLLAKADAIAHASENLFEESIWDHESVERRRFELVAHLVGATAEAIEVAAEFGDELVARFAAEHDGT